MIGLETYPVNIQGGTDNDRMAVLMSFLYNFQDVRIINNKAQADDLKGEITFSLETLSDYSRLYPWLRCMAKEHPNVLVIY